MWPFRRKSPREIKINIRQYKEKEVLGKTYYKRILRVPMKLGSGTGTFKLVVSKRAKYLLLKFEKGGIQPKKMKQKNQSREAALAKALYEHFNPT